MKGKNMKRMPIMRFSIIFLPVIFLPLNVSGHESPIDHVDRTLKLYVQGDKLYLRYKLRQTEIFSSRSHAERGNEEDCDKATSNCTTIAVIARWRSHRWRLIAARQR